MQDTERKPKIQNRIFHYLSDFGRLLFGRNSISNEGLGSHGEGMNPFRKYSSLDNEKWFELVSGLIHETSDEKIIPLSPPDEIQKNFTGRSGIDTFRQAFEFYQMVTRSVGVYYSGGIEEAKILDFGCGWGRIIRFFLRDMDPSNIYGCDCVDDMIEICKKTNQWCNFFKSNTYPPLNIEPGYFDIIYAYSVFSHVSEDAQKKWLSEFHRILKPGGILILTTRRFDFIDQIEAIYPESQFDANTAKQDYLEGKYVHFSYGGGYSLEESYWGETAIPREYIENVWTNLFSIVDFIETGKEVDQNVIVAVKK